MNFFKKHWKKFLFGVVCFFAFYAIVGFFGVPYFLKNTLPNLLSDKANLSIKEAKFNPFSFKLDLRNLELTTNKPLFSVDEANLELNPKSLFKKDIFIKNLTLNSPNTQIYRDKNGKFNFDSFLSDEANNDENSTSFFNLVLENFKIQNGSALYSDESFAKPFLAKLENLNYEIKNLNLGKNSIGSHDLNSNSQIAKNIKHGANISLNPLEITGNLEISELNLSHIWQSFVDLRDLNLTKSFLSAKIPYKLNLDNGINLSVKNANLNLADNEFSEFGDIISFSEIIAKNLNLDLDFNDNLDLDLNIDQISLPNFAYSNPDFKVSSQNNELEKTLLNLKIENNSTNLSVKNENINHKNIEFNFQNHDFVRSENLALNGVNFVLNDQNFSAAINTANLGKTGTFSGQDNFGGFESSVAEKLSFDINKLFLKVQNAVVNSPKFISSIDENGVKSINSLAILKFAKDFNSTKKTANLDKNSSNPKTKFDFLIQNAEVKNGYAKITESFVTPMTHEISGINTTAKNISLNSPFIIKNSINSKQISLNSTTNLNIIPLNLSSAFSLNLPNLEYFNPYVGEFLNAKITSGANKFDGNFTLQSGFSLNGTSEVSNLAMSFANGDKFASFDNLKVGKIALTQNSLNLENINLNSPFSKIVVSKNKKLNLANLVKTSSKPKQPQNSGSKSDFDILIKNINIKNGRVNFVDQSLDMPFDFLISKINTSVDEISQKRPAKLKFNGNVGKGGIAQIDLSLYPFAYEKQTTLSLITKGVGLSETTPYSAKFIGRKIDGGMANLKLNYTIKNSKLNATNEVNLDNFTLGEAVESKDAINLPLDLAISVLKDSKDQINVNLPVSGDLKDPKFSFGGVIGGTILKLFSDIALSPFKLIGNVLNIDTKGLDTIDFNAGEAEILASENEKIANLAKIAKEKENIKLILTPTYSEKADAFVFKKQIFDREISNLMSEKDLNYDNAVANFGAKLRVPKSENYENEVIKAVKFDTSRLEKLALKRVENLKSNLINLGVNENQIIVEKPQNSEPKQDIFVPLKLGLKN
ncbi:MULTISPECIES: DUF748 domain-containing protein [unclassified Campylobacter]|uniref:DUF748 domain-containing protein n=1 Tax=unclassified Campylobacter TaxID=2593542 RepID=UPI0022EA0D54|nr:MULTISPECIES: DUF748 domain-containing protein [unclassified Campylobacter]MDA3055358.1 DUF748 domain-containing protein [Campylobacter sp. CN_NA1]MDA3064952.1 DUF748 domain-containing protein [Campylobacter sp. CN_NE4]MDA3068224.1 DUF748 domain-containing protein [Campylobacter sp. CN_NE3]MDA3082463.1 DUF748 domain-containing protein [Campylobacter sp. CN_EL2]MDA3084098.1 DUF748 domain-containing protein [Campylobacter sp. CN_NE1]